MKRLTDSPFEEMMMERPRPPRRAHARPPGGMCRRCAYWRGQPCIGACIKESSSGRHVKEEDRHEAGT